MSEKEKFDGQKQKLENLCDEHNLTFSLKLDNYPVSMTLRPVQGMYDQISMLETAEDGEHISMDAYMTFYSSEGDYTVKSFGTFTMTEALSRKFMNIFKKIDVFWKHFYFRETVETHAIKRGLMPVIDEDEEKPDDEAPPATCEPGENDGTPDEDLLAEATKLVRIENKCTLSLLQRRLRVSYAKGLHILDLLEERGVVGSMGENGKREVLPYDVPESPEA